MFEFLGGAISGFLGFSFFFHKSSVEANDDKYDLRASLTSHNVQLVFAVVVLLVTAFGKTIHIDPSWIQILLGIAFGAAVRYWSSEALPYEKKTNDKWHLVQWVGALGTLLTIGLSYPYLTKYLEGVSHVKLGQLEVTFLNGLNNKAGVVTPVETPYYFHEISPSNQIERAINTLIETPRVIDNDLLILQLKKQLDKTQIVDDQIAILNKSAQFYQEVFKPLVECTRASYKENLVYDVIRAKILPVALQLRFILLKPNLNDQDDHPELEKLFPRINEAIFQFNELMITNHGKCDSLVQYYTSWTIDDLKSLAKANYIFRIAANLMFLSGSMDAAIDLLEKSPDQWDVNVNYQLARLKYWRGDNLKNVLVHYDAIRDFSVQLDEQVQLANKRKLNIPRLSDIGGRAKDIQRFAENSIAYFCSLLNIRPSLALAYAQQYYESDKDNANAIDTYALANMVFAADDNKLPKVNQSIRLFEEALEIAESMQEGTNKKKYIAEISNHLLQANRLLYFLTNGR